MKEIKAYETAEQEGILLNANERSEALPEYYLREVADAVLSLTLNRYPDNSQRELLQAYAAVNGLNEDMLLAGNGSDQVLGHLIGTFLGKGKILYTYDPDFSMYDYFASSYEGEVRKFTINEDGSLDIEEFIRTGREVKPSLVMFSNPNNPSGHCLSISEIEKIIVGFTGIPVCVDEAYIEFADEESAVSLLDRYDNLYISRTLSKGYGLAGIRIGFLISRPENMKPLKDNYVPYALNVLSMKAAVIALKHHAEAEAFIERTREERRRMQKALADSKRARYILSQANFIYGYSSEKERLMELLDDASIVIRNYEGSDTFRISVGTAKENDRVLEVLKQFEEEKTCGQ